MKKKFLLFMLIVMAFVCLLAVSISAESAYVNANGEQVEAGSNDIAYELEIENPWETGGNCKIKYIYLYDASITKLVIPAIELTHPSNGKVYKMAEYSYVRLSTGYGSTLGVYTLADRDAKENSLHAQIKELEFHIPILGDGAGNFGNLAGWSGLEKLSFYSKAYESQSKGGFLSGCTSIKEIHFYGANNTITENFFPSTMVAGGKIVFHENASGKIKSSAMQDINGKDVTVYMNALMQPADSTDPRLTWNKNGNGLLKFVLLVNDKSDYTPEEIASYTTVWQAGNNKNANNATYSMPIQTYCEYYGAHSDMEAVSGCVSNCVACKEVAIPQNPVHNYVTSITYSDLAKAGTKLISCTNENCPLKATPTQEEAPIIFEFVGYSTKLYASAICVSYNINQAALEEYKSVNEGITVSYGIVAAAYVGEVDAQPLDKATNIQNDMTDAKYNSVDLKITANWDEAYDDTMSNAQIKLAMALYTTVTNDDGTITSYVTSAGSSTECEVVTFESESTKE